MSERILKFNVGDKLESDKPDNKTGRHMTATVMKVCPDDHYAYLTDIDEGSAAKWWPAGVLEHQYHKVGE